MLLIVTIQNTVIEYVKFFGPNYTQVILTNLYYRIASEDNSAMANLDYAPLVANNAITISPSDGIEKSVPVNIINDTLFEDEENFRVRLSSTDPSVAITGLNPANVFIVDDDGKMHIVTFIIAETQKYDYNLQTPKLHFLIKFPFESNIQRNIKMPMKRNFV